MQFSQICDWLVRVAIITILPGILRGQAAEPHPGWPLTFPLAPLRTSTPICADLDGDGLQEVLFAVQGLGLFAARGDGTILPGFPVNPEAPMFPFLVEGPIRAGDLDGDGRMEIVAVSIGDGDRRIWAFTTTGVVKAGFPIEGGNYLIPGVLGLRGWNLALVDLTGDSALEIVTSQTTEASFSTDITHAYAFDGFANVLLGWPMEFDMSPSYQTYSGHIAVGDLDFDGVNEVVLPFYKYSGAGGSTLEGGKIFVVQGDGSVRPGWPVDTPNYFLSPVIGDLNGDGACEIIGHGIGETYLYGPDGALESSYSYTQAGRPFALADIEGDGSIEIATPWLELRLYQWPSTMIAETDSPPHRLYQGITIADFDGDGGQEIVTISDSTPPIGASSLEYYLHILNGSSLEERVEWPRLLLATQTLGIYYGTAISDLDGDGDLEIIYPDSAEYLAGTIAVIDIPKTGSGPATIEWPMFGHDQYTSFNYHTPRPQPSYLRGDANRDGQVDITDPLVTLGYLFQGVPSECPAAMDATGEGVLNITDPVHLLYFLFAIGATSIPAPFPDCAAAPQAGPLRCAFFICP